jgi:hypothetical protein
LSCFFAEAYTHRRWSRVKVLLVVGRDDERPQLGADSLNQVPAVPEEGEVAQ